MGDWHEKNPGYYDFETAIQEIDKKYWLSASSQLENIARTSLYRYETNLFAYKQQYEIKPLAYIEMQIRLYKKLVEVANQMVDVAQKLKAAANWHYI